MTDIPTLVERVAFIVTALFTVYKLFFDKKKNEIGLDSSKIKLLQEIQELEEGKVRKLMDDYLQVSANYDKLKELLRNQEDLILHYENIMSFHKIDFKNDGVD